MAGIPVKFLKFWNKNRHLAFGEAVKAFNSAGMSPKIRIIKA